MASSPPPPPPQHPAHRPKVRIRKPKRITWAGGVSLGVACGAALLIILVRFLVRTEVTVAPYMRTLGDVTLEWRCDSGHLFHAAGQVDPRACWTCGRPAHPVTQFECPLHGRFEVAVRFGRGEGGMPVPTHFKALSTPRDWVAAEAGVQCPRCHRTMTRVTEPSIPVRPSAPDPRPDRR